MERSSRKTGIIEYNKYKRDMYFVSRIVHLITNCQDYGITKTK